MKTNEAFKNEIRRSRRKLFFKLYVLPWSFLTFLLMSIIGYLAFQNTQLEIRNTELVKKIQHKTILVSQGDSRISTVEKTEAAQPRGFDWEYHQAQEENNTDNSKVEKVEVANIDNSKVEKSVDSVDPELLELYRLKDQFDRDSIQVRSSDEIREDFGLIRTHGFSRENYVYAQELGVRIEVQLIKDLEIILEKKFDEYEGIFNSDRDRDIFHRELRYELNEGVLNRFRSFWEFNKN